MKAVIFSFVALSSMVATAGTAVYGSFYMAAGATAPSAVYFKNLSEVRQSLEKAGVEMAEGTLPVFQFNSAVVQDTMVSYNFTSWYSNKEGDDCTIDLSFKVRRADGPIAFVRTQHLCGPAND